MFDRLMRLRRWWRQIEQRRSVSGQYCFPMSIHNSGVERVRQQYQESEKRFRKLLESLPRVAVQGYDKHRRVIYWNEASSKLYGYTAEQALGQMLEDLIIPHEMRSPVVDAHQAWINEGREIPAEELELLHHSGGRVPVFSHHVMLGEHTHDPIMFCVDVDLSDQKRASRDLDFAIRYDPLTRLYNRRTLEVRLQEALDVPLVRQAGLAVVYLDIDRFSEFNNALGYDLGDQLLSQMANRLCEELGLIDVMSRVSSDEFVLVFVGIHRRDEINQLIGKIQHVLSFPFTIDGVERRVTVSSGVSLYPDHGTSARELIRHADVAKNRAKLDGLGGVQLFQQSHHDEVVRRQHLVERLERSIERQELSLHYQPQVSVASGHIENLEALLRWNPQGYDGVVTPAEFIPLAERSDLIHRLGDWVMEEACRQQADWRQKGLQGTRVDINLSGRQMLQPSTLVRFEACLARHGLLPQDVGIELTENVLIDASPSVLENLRRLYHRGVRIAIDDFGTGYSSLSYLKQFPVTSLKVDKSFMRDAHMRPEDRSILEAAIFIGHRLGLEVVVEGVETAEQHALVKELQCDLAQGYLFYRPMSASDVWPLLDAPQRPRA